MKTQTITVPNGAFFAKIYLKKNSSMVQKHDKAMSKKKGSGSKQVILLNSLGFTRQLNCSLPYNEL